MVVLAKVLRGCNLSAQPCTSSVAFSLGSQLEMLLRIINQMPQQQYQLISSYVIGRICSFITKKMLYKDNQQNLTYVARWPSGYGVGQVSPHVLYDEYQTNKTFNRLKLYAYLAQSVCILMGKPSRVRIPLLSNLFGWGGFLCGFCLRF